MIERGTLQPAPVFYYKACIFEASFVYQFFFYESMNYSGRTDHKGFTASSFLFFLQFFSSFFVTSQRCIDRRFSRLLGYIYDGRTTGG